MEKAIADLKDTLREHIATIRDKESRRNADTRIARLRASRKKSKNCKRPFRSQSIPGWHIVSSAKLMTRRSSI
jgi:hypothetical protein